MARSAYGANKALVEALGRYFATAHDLDVICIRFGAVRRDNAEPPEPAEKAIWLVHEDCVALVRRCVEAELARRRLVVLYGVSDNDPPVVDLTNPLGWQPAKGRIGVGEPVEVPPAPVTLRNHLGRLRRRLRSGRG